MYRIRFHGRGGQHLKTAGQILGSAFFLQGFEVQDAPRYGAERRGAPIFAYVRASRGPIHERGVITRPDLVVVVDDSLIAVPAAGALQGMDERTVFLVASPDGAELWRQRLGLRGPVLALADAHHGASVALRCAGAAARLVGVLDRAVFEQAVRAEIARFGEEEVERALAAALAAFDELAPHAGLVREGDGSDAGRYVAPEWIDVPLEPPRVAAPAIHAVATSELAQTGSWRTMRPVIDYARCNRCSWICSTFCPDGAIRVDSDRTPRIDYDHCKGCLVCVAVCPPHAIRAVPEGEPVHAVPSVPASFEGKT